MPIPRLHKETSLFNRTRTFSSTFRVLADSITSLVKGTETYTDPVTGETKTNTFGTLLQQTANNVLIKATASASTASQGGRAIIESLINVAPEGIKIAADRVDIEGAVIFKSGKLSKVVTSSQTQWYSSTSPSQLSGGSWVTTQPNVTAGRYLWERTVYNYSNNTQEYKPSENGVCVTAPTDIAKTVSSVDVEYAQGTSPTTAPTSGWNTSAPTIAAGKYLWTRTKTVLKDNTTTYTKTTCISGVNGKIVTSAKEQYYLSTSATECKGGSWVDTCPAWQSGKAIWTRTHLTYADGTTGATTATLATALNDANSKASATITGVDVEYADSTSQTTAPTSGWATTSPAWQEGHFIWQRTKTVTAAGTSYSAPTCISGRDGVDGKDGKNGTNGTNGVSAYAYAINANPAALVRTESGTLTPSSIAFSATRAQGTGDPAGYSGRFVISEYDGSTWADKYTSSSNERTKSYAPSSTAKVVKCTLYLAGTTPGNTTPLDMQSVPIASNGTNGVSITGVTEYYARNNSTTAPADSAFGTSVLTPTASERYVWNYESIAYSSGSPTKTAKHIVAVFGDAGAAGRGIASVTEYYAINNSTTAPADSAFSTAVKTATAANKYLWNYEVISYTTGDPTTTAKRIIGTYGSKGDQGADAYTVLLTNESHTFAASTSAAVAGSTTSQVIAYKGATQVVATIGTISGAPTGMSTAITNNGKTNAGFSVTVTTSLTTRQGVLTIPVTVDGKSFSLQFSWSLALTGATGAKGANGVGIKSIVEQYYLSTSNTSQTGGSWVTTPPAYAKGKYYWTRSKITWTDNKETYTDPVLANDVTSIAEVANASVKTATQLWFTKADDTAPAKPTSKVTSASTAGNGWRVIVPAYNASYPNYFYCWQYEQMDGTFTWSDVVHDRTATETFGKIRGGLARSQLIYRNAPAGTNTMSPNTTWVTETGEKQGAWTTKRLEYDASYPVIFVATQSQTVGQQATGSTCSCTTPLKDDTLTKIDGGHITTGTIDASKVTVTNIDASNINTGTLRANVIGAKSIAIDKLSTSLQDTLNKVNRDTAYRGVCSTSETIAAKTVSCTGFDLVDGAVITVYNRVEQVHAGGALTLNVSKTGAYTIYVDDQATSSTNQLLWAVGSSVTYVFRNDCWCVVDNPGTWEGGTCSVASGTAGKTASVGQCVLFKGASVKVRMSYDNTASSPTLNVQSLGAKNVYFGSASNRPTRDNGYSWKGGSLVEFVFDGQYWRTGTRTYINGGDIVTGTIDASKVTVTNLDASKITTGTLSADRINVNAIKANIINAIEITGEKIKGGTISGVNVNFGGSGHAISFTANDGYMKFKMNNREVATVRTFNDQAIGIDYSSGGSYMFDRQVFSAELSGNGNIWCDSSQAILRCGYGGIQVDRYGAVVWFGASEPTGNSTKITFESDGIYAWYGGRGRRIDAD